MLSSAFILMPPETMLAKHSSRRTTCISEPWAIMSSMAETCPETSYNANRSVTLVSTTLEIKRYDRTLLNF